MRQGVQGLDVEPFGAFPLLEEPDNADNDGVGIGRC